MKKIIKPKQEEESVFYSDFSGKCFGQWPPSVELTLEFNYGSKYDGSKLKFDLDDEDLNDVLLLIKHKLTSEAKKEVKNQLNSIEDKYDGSVQSRDWETCEYYVKQTDLLKYLLES